MYGFTIVSIDGDFGRVDDAALARGMLRAHVDRQGAVRIGTSGWHYMHWKGPFYPKDMRPGQFLACYSSRFATVEINNTFYRLPAAGTFETWREVAPPGFVYAVKASRFITHLKKLSDPPNAIRDFFARVEGLGSTLGPILFQLPPHWGFNGPRLEAFLAALPPGRRCAFEFRDPSWFTREAYDALARAGAALCIYDMNGHVSPIELTGNWTYIRFHGMLYSGSYSAKDLAPWAALIRRYTGEGRDVYAYFNNDSLGRAPNDAVRLREMVEGRMG